MKVIKLTILILLSIYFIIVDYVVKSDDSSCLKELISKLFSVPPDDTTVICSNNIVVNKASYYYKTTCTDLSSIVTLQLASVSQNYVTLGYNDLNCFTDLNELEIKNLKVGESAFGEYASIKVANRLKLYNVIFEIGRFCFPLTSLSSGTNYLEIVINNESNLKTFDFREIKGVKTFSLRATNDLLISNFPTITNNIEGNDINSVSFDTMSLTLNTVPSFLHVRINILNINLISSSTSTTYNLNTLDMVTTLNLYFDENFDYPVQLSSTVNTGLLSLSIGGGLYSDSIIGQLNSPPKEGALLPPNIQKVSIYTSPLFNVDGYLPFFTIPVHIQSLTIDNIGLKYFPTSIPNSINSLKIKNNNFSINNPATLPDLSNFYSLYKLQLSGCGFIGPIPESYCIYDLNVANNDLEGYLPQCISCYIDQYNVAIFDLNPKLSTAPCYRDSIKPSLVYDKANYKLLLTGENLGINGPLIKYQGTDYQFVVWIPQSSYYLSWNEDGLGPVPETFNINFGYHSLEVPTGVLSPSINKITKNGNQYIFTGVNFSYFKKDFEIIASKDKIQGIITFISYRTIELYFSSPLPLGQDIPAKIQRTISKTAFNFTINTIDNKSTNIISCDKSCNEVNNLGFCSSTTGKCVCSTIYYTGEQCNQTSRFITSVSSTTTQGGLVNLYGWFGDNDNFAIKIGDLECKLSFINSNFVNCMVGSGSGTKSIKITDNTNGFMWIGENMFHYTEIGYKCPKNCSSNGICIKSTGECNCYIGYGGYDCNSKTSTDSSSSTTTSSTTTGSYETPAPTLSPIEIPKSNTTVNETSGSTIINNQQTSYEISILSLVELDILDNVVLVHNLTNKWISEENSNSNIYRFTQTIQETCNITYSIEDIKETRDYTFAGLKLSLDKDSIKITIKIENYPFTNALNKLQLRIESSAGEKNNSNLNNECNNKETQIDTDGLDKDQLLNYITISKNEKILYGRFINRVLSDTRESFITTTLVSNSTSTIENKQSFIIGLNLPFFTNSLVIDPDFSVLTSLSFKKCNSNENQRESWVLPVAIVIPCVVVAVGIIVGAIVYSKNRTKILLAKQKYSVNLKNLSKKNEKELYLN